MSLHCQHCKLDVTGGHTVCPLCQGRLELTSPLDSPTFPFIDTIMNRYHFMIRLLFFLSAVLLTICFAANYLFPAPGFWSLVVALGVGCMWASMVIVLRKRHNIPKVILWQAVLFSLVTVAADGITGWHGWSLDYAVPCFFIVAILAMWAVAGILRLGLEEYLVYLLIDVGIGIIPVIFILCGWVSTALPSLLCVLASVITFIALVTFKDRAVGVEIKKRLHL